MLQVKSFDLLDDKGINELLLKYRIAQGASIFISDGKICIPIEDGEPQNNAQKIIAVKEQKNTVLAQMDIIEHSQLVLQALRRDATRRVEEAKANLAEAEAKKKGKDKYDTTKECAETLKNAERALKDLETQSNQNEVEMVRLQLNCELFDERVAELSA